MIQRCKDLPLHPKQRVYSKHSLEGDGPGQPTKKEMSKGHSDTYLRLGHVRKGDPYFDKGKFFSDLIRKGWRIEEGDYRDDITVIVLYLDNLPSSLAPPRT